MAARLLNDAQIEKYKRDFLIKKVPKPKENSNDREGQSATYTYGSHFVDTSALYNNFNFG